MWEEAHQIRPQEIIFAHLDRVASVRQSQMCLWCYDAMIYRVGQQGGGNPFGGGGRGGFGGGFSGGGGGFGGGDFSDFFESMFGGGGRSSGRNSARYKGQDLQAELRISFRDASQTQKQTVTVNGKSLRITIPGGIASGQVIKLTGQGGQGVNGGPNGDRN